MTYVVPRQVKSARAQTINKVTYTANQVLTAAQLKAIPHLSAMLSSGRLIAVPDVHSRRPVRGNHTPSNIPPVVLAQLAKGASLDFVATMTLDTSVGAVDKHYLLTVSLGQHPYTVDWGDGSAVQALPGLVGTHTYATPGAKTVTVTAANGDTTTAAITVVTRPTAAFTSAVTLAKTATFTNTSTGSPTSYDWDYGDGTAHGPTASPVHVYAAAGTWHVTMKATNAGGWTGVVHDVVTT